MTFPSWLDDQYHRMAGEYRAALAAVVRTAQEYAEGNIWEERHTAACVEVMERLPIPVIGKYADPTEEDRAHFGTVRRPEWNEIIEEAVKGLPEVYNNVNPAAG